MDRLARTIHGDSLKVAFAFLLSMPGAPFIYYGDEIGMRYVENLTSVEGGYGRTGSRSPMQWDNSTNSGFSSAPAEELYIKQDEAPDRPTAISSMADEKSLWHEIQRLIAIRQSHEALLSKSGIEFVYAERNEYPLAYIRSAGSGKILVIINPAAREVTFDFGEKLGESIYTFGGKSVQNGAKISVTPCSAGFYKIRN